MVHSFHHYDANSSMCRCIDEFSVEEMTLVMLAIQQCPFGIDCFCPMFIGLVVKGLKLLVFILL